MLHINSALNDHGRYKQAEQYSKVTDSPLANANTTKPDQVDANSQQIVVQRQYDLTNITPRESQQLMADLHGIGALDDPRDAIAMLLAVDRQMYPPELQTGFGNFANRVESTQPFNLLEVAAERQKGQLENVRGPSLVEILTAYQNRELVLEHQSVDIKV